MQSHDCYCFLPMTSLLLQPYHPRKDAIKIFGTGLNDVALQVSNVILGKKNWFARRCRAAVPPAPALSGTAASAGKWSGSRVALRAEGLQVQRLPAGSALCWSAGWHLRQKRCQTGALKPKKALCPCVLLWLLRVSAEFSIYVSSHHHPVVRRDSGNNVLLASPAFWGVLFPGCLKGVVVQIDVPKLLKEWGLTCLGG